MKNILLTVLLFSLGFGLMAQSGVRLGLQVSPLIGYATVTDKNNNDLTDFNATARAGYAYGLAFEYGFTDNYGIHSGINIVNKGFSYQPTGSADPLKWKVTTLQVPIAAKLRSSRIADNLYIKGIFGLTADFQVGHSVEYLSIVNANPPAFEVLSTKDTKRVIPVGFSFIVGPGVDVELPIGTFAFNFVYHQGLTNVNSSKNGFTDTRIKSNYVSLDVAYFF